jgi:hypothetical protein
MARYPRHDWLMGAVEKRLKRSRRGLLITANSLTKRASTAMRACILRS